jgi:hypothetical protein
MEITSSRIKTASETEQALLARLSNHDAYLNILTCNKQVQLGIGVVSEFEIAFGNRGKGLRRGLSNQKQ